MLTLPRLSTVLFDLAEGRKEGRRRGRLSSSIYISIKKLLCSVEKHTYMHFSGNDRLEGAAASSKKRLGEKPHLFLRMHACHASIHSIRAETSSIPYTNRAGSRQNCLFCLKKKKRPSGKRQNGMVLYAALHACLASRSSVEGQERREKEGKYI